MAVFDTSQQDLYVACSGDSRAVAGIWEESPDGTGSWRVEVLSEDQTGRNPNELKRYGVLRPALSSDTSEFRLECNQNILKTRPKMSYVLAECSGVLNLQEHLGMPATNGHAKFRMCEHDSFISQSHPRDIFHKV